MIHMLIDVKNVGENCPLRQYSINIAPTRKLSAPFSWDFIYQSARLESCT